MYLSKYVEYELFRHSMGMGFSQLWHTLPKNYKSMLYTSNEQIMHIGHIQPNLTNVGIY